LVVGSKSSFTHFDQSTAGVILGTDGGTTKFEAVGDSSNYISFNGSSFDVKSSTYDLDATTLKLQSANSGRIMVGDASGQRLALSGSNGELVFFNSDGDQRMRLFTQTEETTYTQANGTTINRSEKAAIQNMTAGRLSVHGAIEEQWDDIYTTSSLEGGKLYMNARQDASLGFAGTAQILSEFHLSGSILSLSAAQGTNAISASSINTGFGQSSGITLGEIRGTLFTTGVRVKGITSTGALAASFSSEGVSGAAGSNRTIALYATENGGNIIIGSGSASEPAYGFSSDRDTGFFMVSSLGNIGVSLAGTEEFRFAAAGNFHADANITAYSSTVSSDERLKENVKPLQNSLDKILQLKPSSFTWKVNDFGDDIGFIAQKIEKVIPELVSEVDSIGDTAKFLDGDKHKVVDYAKLSVYLVDAIQEQQKQIDELKKKLEEL
jgi:hypothetical protein